MRNRRSFTAEFKARVVLEDLTGTKSAAEICRSGRGRVRLLAPHLAKP